MKKSFIVYIDSLDILDELTPSQIANLFLAIKAHHKGEGFELDAITRIALKPFLIQWERDAQKYETACERNKANGLKGGRPKKENQAVYLETEKTHSVILKPKKADSDSDSDSVSDSKKKKSIKKEIEPPTLEEVKQWFTEQGSTAEQGAKAWQYYQDGNWHDAKGQQVKNWRQKMRGGRWLEVRAQPPQTSELKIYKPLNAYELETNDEINDFTPAE
jgi:hypothetical protein